MFAKYVWLHHKASLNQRTWYCFTSLKRNINEHRIFIPVLVYDCKYPSCLFFHVILGKLRIKLHFYVFISHYFYRYFFLLTIYSCVTLNIYCGSSFLSLMRLFLFLHLVSKACHFSFFLLFPLLVRKLFWHFY